MSSDRENRRQLYEQLVGQTVAERYKIVSLMGYGGMGAVYEAHQLNMDRRVALKYIPSHDPVMAKRFEREALTVSKLRHPNTVTVFDYGQTDDGFLFLSMELLSGRTLTDLIEHEAPLAPKRAVHIASQICRSLAEAHEMGIVHRDIKPDNVILIDVDGDPDVVKVLDFGIAKAVEQDDQQTLTGDGRIIGTPRYMSPEQILSEEIDYRSDIYSLGCIIFEMLCGDPPFDAPSTTALMISHAQEPPPPLAQRLDDDVLSGVPIDLENVVRRSMAKSPIERPQTTEELRKELEDSLRGHQPGPHTTGDQRPEPVDVEPIEGAIGAAGQPRTETARTRTSTGSNTVLVAGVTAAAVAVVVLGAAFVLFGDDDDEGEPEDPLAAQAGEAPDDAQPPSEDDDPAQADNQDAPPPTVQANDTHRIRIETAPDGARLQDGNEVLGDTPLNFNVAEPEVLQLVLTKEGHEDKEIEVEVDEDRPEQTFAFELEEDRPAPTARPSPPAQQQPAEPQQEDDDDDIPAIDLIGGDDDDDDDDDGPGLLPAN